MPTIRPETPADHAAVSRVHRRAFGRADEADLVDHLRQEASPTVSLVATEGEAAVLGHIFFSPVTIEPGSIDSGSIDSGSIEPGHRPVLTMGLAPMAVVPERQREGIGSALVEAGLRACREIGAEAVVVLGHPGYYPRFGFRPAETFGLRSEYDVPSEAFLAMELAPGALDARTPDASAGRVRYHPGFGGVA